MSDLDGGAEFWEQKQSEEELVASSACYFVDQLASRLANAYGHNPSLRRLLNDEEYVFQCFAFTIQSVKKELSPELAQEFGFVEGQRRRGMDSLVNKYALRLMRKVRAELAALPSSGEDASPDTTEMWNILSDGIPSPKDELGVPSEGMNWFVRVRDNVAYLPRACSELSPSSVEESAGLSAALMSLPAPTLEMMEFCVSKGRDATMASASDWIKRLSDCSTILKVSSVSKDLSLVCSSYHSLLCTVLHPLFRMEGVPDDAFLAAMNNIIGTLSLILSTASASVSEASQTSRSGAVRFLGACMAAYLSCFSHLSTEFSRAYHNQLICSQLLCLAHRSDISKAALIYGFGMLCDTRRRQETDRTPRDDDGDGDDDDNNDSWRFKDRFVCVDAFKSLFVGRDAFVHEKMISAMFEADLSLYLAFVHSTRMALSLARESGKNVSEVMVLVHRVSMPPTMPHQGQSTTWLVEGASDEELASVVDLVKKYHA